MIEQSQIEQINARHGATIGMSGSGKTFTEKGLVESLLAAGRHTVIIDPLGAWYGLRTGADGESAGFAIPIFGGEHGDLDIGIWDGVAIADIVLNQRVSCIIDLSKFRTGADQRTFMEAFVGALRGKPRGSLNLIVDEADEFAPETAPDKIGYRLREDMIWIAKRGRLSGFILHIITQRPADISKSVLTQMQTLIIHQLIAPLDQAPVDKLLKGWTDKETHRKVMGSLASLRAGERWIYSPKAGILDLDFSPRISTFDSSRTPEPGEALAQAKTLAQIDVSAIKGALKNASVQKPVEDAPREAELAAAYERIAALDDMNERLTLLASAAQDGLNIAREAEKSVRQAVECLEQAFRTYDSREISVAAPAAPVPKLPGAPADDGKEGAGSPPRAAPSNPSTSLNTTAMAFVDMLDRINPARVTWAQLAAMTGRKPRGGNFNAARKQIRESGRVIEEGQTLRSSAPSPKGMSRAEAFALWHSVVSGPADKMLDALNSAGNPLTKQELADAIGLKPVGGHWNNGMAQLRRNGLIGETADGQIALVSSLPGER